jgi:tetratricopeptide (TPR) repeat protein
VSFSDSIYQNFDVLLTRALDPSTPAWSGRYHVSVQQTLLGDSYPGHDFDLDFDQLGLASSDLAAAARSGGDPMRELLSQVQPVANAEVAQVIGQRLFRAIFAESIGSSLRQNVNKAREPTSRAPDGVDPQAVPGGLRIRLYLNLAPELGVLPWELLNDPDRGYLCLSRDTVVVRYADSPDPVRTTPIHPPLKIAVMVSNPSNLPPLEVDEEWKRLKVALEPLKDTLRVEVERLEAATLTALQSQLFQSKCHIFHYIGHGGIKSGNGVLYLEDENRHADPVSAEQLVPLLRDHDSLRLVVLNACKGAAQAAEGNPFVGLAQQLTKRGIPAVIGMQFAISDRAAIQFGDTFYRTFADGYQVETALTEARKAVHNHNPVEWATPVLYLRSQDTETLRVERLTDAEWQQRRVRKFTSSARVAARAEDWPTAAQKWRQVLEEDSEHLEAQAGLKHALELQAANAAYARGQEHLKEGRLREALDEFLEIQRLASNLHGVYRLIATIKKEIGDNSAPVDPSGFRQAVPGRVASMALAPAHYKQVVQAFLNGGLIPFLGPDVNLCGRPPGLTWQRDQYPPSATELAAYLIDELVAEALPDVPLDLARAAQYAAVASGPAQLYDSLRKVYAASYEPTAVHQLLASVPRVLREQDCSMFPLIVTTNYDDLLERAFQKAGEPFDIVSYTVRDDQSGIFVHWDDTGTPHEITLANEYMDVAPDRQTVILKVHGAFDRTNSRRDSYVITEDHFINYLTGTEITKLLPVTLVRRFKQSRLLFLGYGLRSWDMRVIFRRIWGEEPLNDSQSWCVELDPQPIDRSFWRRSGVILLEADLETYVAELSDQLQSLKARGDRA